MRLQSCEKAMGWCTAQCKMLLFCVKLCEIDIGPTKGTGLLFVGYLGNAALLHIFMECSSIKMQTPCVLRWSRSKMLWGRSEGLWGRSKVLWGHSAILWQKSSPKINIQFIFECFHDEQHAHSSSDQLVQNCMTVSPRSTLSSACQKWTKPLLASWIMPKVAKVVQAAFGTAEYFPSLWPGHFWQAHNLG